MTTRLDKPLKRELEIDGQPYVLTITPEGVKITLKGRRLGREMSWRNLLSGDAELATQLLRSLSDEKSKQSGNDQPQAAKAQATQAEPSKRRSGRKAR